MLMINFKEFVPGFFVAFHEKNDEFVIGLNFFYKSLTKNYLQFAFILLKRIAVATDAFRELT